MSSVAITTDVVSSNPAHGEVYSIQHYKVAVSTKNKNKQTKAKSTAHHSDRDELFSIHGYGYGV